MHAVAIEHLAFDGGSRHRLFAHGFNSKLRDELLNGEIFYSVKEAKVMIEQWRRHYNTVRPHSSLGYRPPAPETRVTPPAHDAAGPPSASLRPDQQRHIESRT